MWGLGSIATAIAAQPSRPPILKRFTIVILVNEPIPTFPLPTRAAGVLILLEKSGGLDFRRDGLV